MSLNPAQPAAASNDDQRSTSEQLARIRAMNLKADEIRAEAGLIEAKKRLKEAQRGEWWIAPLVISTMIMTTGAVAVGILIGRMWR